MPFFCTVKTRDQVPNHSKHIESLVKQSDLLSLCSGTSSVTGLIFPSVPCLGHHSFSTRRSSRSTLFRIVIKGSQRRVFSIKKENRSSGHFLPLRSLNSSTLCRFFGVWVPLGTLNQNPTDIDDIWELGGKGSMNVYPKQFSERWHT